LSVKKPLIRRIGRDESGATAIEYGLIVGIMSVVIVGIAAAGGALDAVYDRVSDIVAAMSDSGAGGDGG
jgi:pilus assembly protein Flp/PilA